MQFKVFFLLCVLQIAQFVSAQCGCGYGPGYVEPGYYAQEAMYYAPELAYGPGYINGMPWGYDNGDVSAAGTLPVTGKVNVDGLCPVTGTVQYAGDVAATGTTSVYCSCGNIWY